MKKFEVRISESLLIYLLEGKEAIVSDVFENEPLYMTLNNNVNLENIAVQLAEMNKASVRTIKNLV